MTTVEEIDLSHFRARLVRHKPCSYTGRVTFGLAGARRYDGSRWRSVPYSWVHTHEPHTPQSEEEARTKAKELNEAMQRRLNAERQHSAVARRRHMKERQSEAFQEQHRKTLRSAAQIIGAELGKSAGAVTESDRREHERSSKVAASFH
jgi:hypothetical protein